MWDWAGLVLGSGGVLGLLALIVRAVVKLHNDAVLAERQRADDHREAYRNERELADERWQQVLTLQAEVSRLQFELSRRSSTPRTGSTR